MNILLKTLLSLTMLLSIHLHGSLFDYVKGAPDKSDEHRIRNIDFIYMINLDQRPEKFDYCLKQLLPYGVRPYRFSAVNGWELTLEQINDIGVKFSPGMEGGFLATSFPLDGNFKSSHEVIENYGQTYFVHCCARGTIGIAMSHISVLQDAYDSGYETIWVMEDDVRVDQDPNILSILIDKLDRLVGKDNWDILFTDQDIRNQNDEYIPAYASAKRPNFTFTNNAEKRYQISKDFRTIGARFGAHSMILRRSGIEKLLNFFREHQMYLPYDIDYYNPPGIKMFTVIKDVVTNTPGSLSDNARPAYLKSKQKKNPITKGEEQKPQKEN